MRMGVHFLMLFYRHVQFYSNYFLWKKQNIYICYNMASSYSSSQMLQALPTFQLLPYPNVPITGSFNTVDVTTMGEFQNASQFYMPTDPSFGIYDPADPSGGITAFTNLIFTTSQVVGGTSVPFLPIGVSSYIPTLYSNVQAINSNLVNQINFVDLTLPQDTASRNYPTVNAVQQFVESYVQAQVNGVQLIDSAYLLTDPSGIIDITSDSTIVEDLLATPTVPSYTDLSTGYGFSQYVYSIANSSLVAGLSSAAVKHVVCNLPILAATSTSSGLAVFISAGANNTFYHHGVQSQYYVPAVNGDVLSYVQLAYGNGYIFYVITLNGRMSNYLG